MFNALKAWLKELPNSIKAIKSWQNLLGAAVLASITSAIIVMILTPKGNPLGYLYPVGVLVLVLAIVITAAIITDRKNKREFEFRKTKANEIVADEKRSGASVKANYINNELGFKLYQSEDKAWSKPRVLTFTEFSESRGIVFPDDAARQLAPGFIPFIPFFQMFLHSQYVDFQYGKAVAVKMTVQTLAPFVEEEIEANQKRKAENNLPSFTKEQVDLFKKMRNLDGKESVEFTFANGLSANVMEKKYAPGNAVKPNLANVFRNIVSTGEPLQNIIANENSLLAVTKQSYSNVLLNGRPSGFTIFRMYKLYETETHLYVAQAQWSPETDSAPEAWEEIKKMLNSFQLLQ